MRRHVLHITVAVLTFSAGFLTVGRVEDLSEALPLALCVFVVTRTVPEFRFKLPSEFDFHKLKVVAITLVLWIPVLLFYLPLLIPQSGLSHCTPDLP